MNAFRTVFTIARVEIRLLFRSWGFRIFSGIALILLTAVMVALTLSPYAGLYFSRALSGAFPLIVLKLLTVFQGLMAVFVATEFLGRDRKLDTTEVIYAHPFANGPYLLGKFAGVLGAFAVLDAVVLLIAVVIHRFFSQTPFAAAPYLLYLLLINIPTLVFMIGLTIFLGSLIKQQAIVYLLALSYVVLSLVLIGPSSWFAFDAFAFHVPLFYSDFIGLGNLSDLLALRGMYVLLGLGFVLGATLLMKRLRQASRLDRVLGFAALLCAAGAAVLGYGYLHNKAAARDFRAGMILESRDAAAIAAPSLRACDIRLKHEGSRIAAEADLTLFNSSDAPLKTILLTLNPGLEILEAKGASGTLSYQRTRHLIEVDAPELVPPGSEFRLTLSYAGPIDERYCYLDIGDTKLETPLRSWLLSIPKRFAVVRPDFVHLTPESGWYPRPGLPEALLFPLATRQDYPHFTVSVETPAGLTAISQGIATVEGSVPRKTTRFRPKTPLPQISLTLGRYESKSIDVDGVRYSLYILEGHDRFTPKFSEIKAELPQLIKQFKDSYEVLLGLTYPFEQFALVEVPIQVTSHTRLWTTAPELVQPQLTFIPEMGVFSTGAEFRMGRAMGGPGGAGPAGAAGQRAAGMRGGAQIGPKDIQRQMINRFVQANLSGASTGPMGFRQRGPLGLRIETNSEARADVFPNFLTYASRCGISAWPLLDYALEAYLHARVPGQAGPVIRIAQSLIPGGPSQEAINDFLLDHSLAEALRPSERGTELLPFVLEEKGKYLWTLIRASLGAEDFDDRLIAFLKSRRFLPITRRDVEDFIAGIGRLDLDKIIAGWYRDKGLPGFLIDNIQSYRVVDGEKTKFQIKFRASNPTDREGVLKVNLITRGGFGARGGGGGMMAGPGGAAAASDSRTVLLPGRTVKDVGIVLDQAAVITTIDTTMSQNLPPVFALPFSNQPPAPGIKPFDGEMSQPYVESPPGAGGEYIVDNEDKEFRLPEKGRGNWLRRSVRRLFISEGAETDSVGAAAIMNPPEEWSPLVIQSFYGRFVRSAFVKKSGTGASKVAWTAKLAEPGRYDIYFYYEGFGGAMGRGGGAGMRGMAGGPGGAGMPAGAGQRPGGAPAGANPAGQGPNAQRLRPGTKHFLVHHEDGVEEVAVELKDARPGWILIGNFRLAAGENLVELTDKNEARFVLADAVKWVQEKAVEKKR